MLKCHGLCIACSPAAILSDSMHVYHMRIVSELRYTLRQWSTAGCSTPPQGLVRRSGSSAHEAVEDQHWLLRSQVMEDTAVS